MCGRYALYGPKARLYEQFSPGFVEIDDRPDTPFGRYNIAPSQAAPVVSAAPGDERTLLDAKWGLLPSWVKEPARLPQPINAKIETASEKPMFKHAFKKARVLIPASGFYEWQVVPGAKQPFFIRPVGLQFFGFGGLLEHWHGPEGTVATFCILTTAANELMQPIHERMPVIIQPSDYKAWLASDVTDLVLVRELAGAYPTELMEAYPVGRAVGNPRSQGEDLIRPIEL